MKILFAGKDKFEYHRTLVLLEGLKHCDDIEFDLFFINNRNAKSGNLFRKKTADFDFVIVPAFRHRDVRWVKKYSSAPVVFDPLISKYLTRVIDFKQWYKAPMKYFLDWRALRSADYVLADTEAMRQYYIRKWKLKEKNTAVLPIGFIEKDFPQESMKQPGPGVFKVGFYGSFVPLQGVDVIIKAASLLNEDPEIQFEIIGSGYEKKKIDALQKKLGNRNIEYTGWLPYNHLATKIAGFDICLGIFGSSIKADYVVPNKVFHYAAMQKCIISKRTVGIREVFSQNENIFLIDNNPQSLVSAIFDLKENWEQRLHLAHNASELIRAEYNERKIAEKLIEILNSFRNEKDKS